MTTAIEWTDRVWNPVTGCTKVSQGCKNCYAEGIANRRLPHGGFKDREFTEVRCHPERLSLPLSWRKPQRVFVNSMSDLFHEDVPSDFVDKVFAVMAMAPHLTFQVLTKRPERMRDYLLDDAADEVGPQTRHERVERIMDQPDWVRLPAGRGFDRVIPAWPLPNVCLGVSVEDQATARERIWPLLTTPAARRFVSYEPALGPVDLDAIEALHKNWRGHTIGRYLDWVIVGGESGPGARPFDVKWLWTIIEQCQRSETPVFVKQLGAKPYLSPNSWRESDLGIHLRDRKGADISEWPQLFRVREFPCA